MVVSTYFRIKIESYGTVHMFEVGIIILTRVKKILNSLGDRYVFAEKSIFSFKVYFKLKFTLNLKNKKSFKKV